METVLLALHKTPVVWIFDDLFAAGLNKLLKTW